MISPVDFRRALLGWYDRHGRHDLPWRGAFTPYKVMVSEFMLQQTTVAAVIPYFHRFLEAFPTLRDLAEAPVERVLELWSGLGYYARARNLHAAARALVEKHGGRLPETRAAVEELPGVGPYTAGALLSFIHDKPEALVDGNVVRVLARIFGVTEDVKAPAVKEKLWALAWKLTPPSGARHFNSALMDFGATVCRPKGPDCLVCPFYQDCWARRNGRENDIPAAAAERARKSVSLHVGLLRRGDAWALVQRPEKGLYAGMWELPTVEAPARARLDEVRRAIAAVVGAEVDLAGALAPVTHVLTHRQLTLRPWTGAARAAGRAAWKTPAEIAGMAVASYTRKILDAGLRRAEAAA